MSALKRNIWTVAVATGLVFIVAGSVMLWQGMAARNDVRENLVAEGITTSNDAVLFGVQAGVPVDSADRAWAQAQVIRYHSLSGEPEVVDGQIVGGVTYAQMERDDPDRDRYASGVNLRNALTLAYMGFKVADLVMGVGATFIVLGASLAGLLGPALYWAREPKAETAGTAATAGGAHVAPARS